MPTSTVVLQLIRQETPHDIMEAFCARLNDSSVPRYLSDYLLFEILLERFYRTDAHLDEDIDINDALSDFLAFDAVLGLVSASRLDDPLRELFARLVDYPLAMLFDEQGQATTLAHFRRDDYNARLHEFLSL